MAQNNDHFIKTTGVLIRESDWDMKGMRIKGETQNAYIANATLDSHMLNSFKSSTNCFFGGKPFNIRTIQKSLEGNELSQLTVMQIYDEQHVLLHFGKHALAKG